MTINGRTLRHFLKIFRFRLPEMEWSGWFGLFFWLSLLVIGSPCFALFCSAMALLLCFCTTLNFPISLLRSFVRAGKEKRRNLDLIVVCSAG